jgi:hypothetical protein
MNSMQNIRGLGALPSQKQGLASLPVPNLNGLNTQFAKPVQPLGPQISPMAEPQIAPVIQPQVSPMAEPQVAPPVMPPQVSPMAQQPMNQQKRTMMANALGNGMAFGGWGGRG